MRQYFASTKRPPSKPWIGSIRCCRCRRDGWSATALSTTARELFRCTPRLPPKAPQCWPKLPPITPARSLWPSSPTWLPTSRAARRFILSPTTCRRIRPGGLSNFLRLTPNCTSTTRRPTLPGSTRSKTGSPRSSAMSFPAASFPRYPTWPASSCAISATTTALPNPSSGPIATPTIALPLIPLHLLPATSSLPGKWHPTPLPAPLENSVDQNRLKPRRGRQNAYVEPVIGSIRRECLDHVIVINESHLRRVLTSYVVYYHRSRTHLSLDKDCPDARPIQPPNNGKVIAIPQVGGLHHRYERLAA